MTDYIAPIPDMEFVLNELADLHGVSQLPGFEDATADLVSAVLEESGRFSAEVLAPLNRIGDEQGSSCDAGEVRTPEGWRDAYRGFVEGGWNGLAFDAEHGGQGLPWLVATAVQEMWHSANMSFGLCPMLTQGVVHAIDLHGTAEQKAKYLAKLVSGEWAGTMNLTESQAGSDLGALRTKAEPSGDHYLITGQKIFITYGEHDLTDNIIHMVLARTPDAPPGVKGISMFIVPKFLVGGDGALGERNDVYCVSIEEKLGIHGSPTAVMSYGDSGGAIGYLIGEENRGLEYMFTMMNLARHAVGIEGLAIAERAYQQAREYAMARVQGRAAGSREERVTIINHPDVRRMLMTMKSQIEAMRGLSYLVGSALDKSARHPDPQSRKQQSGLVELLMPIVKGWCTELGNEIAYLGVQIHGCMGFIEETGAAQHLRDARITTIYEGTTGIQAADLVGRKVLRDDGANALAVVETMRETSAELDGFGDAPFAQLKERFDAGIEGLVQATGWIVKAQSEDPRLPAAASMNYLLLWGTVAGAWQMTRSACAAQRRLDAGANNPDFYRAKLTTADYYCGQILPKWSSLLAAIVDGSDSVMGLDENQF